MFKVFVRYPSFQEELEVARRTTTTLVDAIEPVLTAREILELQRIVRRGAGLATTSSATRWRWCGRRAVREPGVPDFIQDQLAWGAGPRAVQFLILGAKARALLEGRTHVTCAGHPGPGQAGAAPPPGAELHRRERGRHRRPVDRPHPVHHPHPRRRADPRCAIPKDFCILKRSSGSRGWTCARGTSSKGSSRACTAARTSASRSSSASTASTPTATTCATSIGRSGPSRTATTSSSSRRTRTCGPTLLVDVSGSMRYGRGAMNKYEYGCTIAASLAYLLLRQQDAVGCVAFDHEIRTAVPLRTRRNHLDSILQAMDVSEPRGQDRLLPDPPRGRRDLSAAGNDAPGLRPAGRRARACSAA